MNGQLEVVRLLLQAKADKDKATNHGATTGFAAAQQGNSGVVRLLLEAKADKDNGPIHGAMLLFAAAQHTGS